MIGGIETGGTKVVVAVAERAHPDRIVALDRFATTTPEESLARAAAFFASWELEAVGVAAFGPLDLRRGTILQTPKEGWSGFGLKAWVEKKLGVSCTVETDVNAAALAEARLGHGRAADPIVYFTVGTGIGGGVVVGGAPIHGLLHPEVGHVPIPTAPGDDFEGVCPFHRRCLEGIASGTAIEKRAGRPARDVPPGDPLWDHIARAIAHGVATTVLVVSPERVIVGGGVMQQSHLYPKIRAHLREILAGFVPHRMITEDNDRYLVAPGLRDPGVYGALLVAAR